jgi:hypothetical protein
MSVNSIADGMAIFKLPTYKSAVEVKLPAKVESSDAALPDASAADKKPTRGMNHVTESYDANGRVVTKFMDSSNHVIYQTPSETAVKTLEMMTNTQATANVKG